MLLVIPVHHYFIRELTSPKSHTLESKKSLHTSKKYALSLIKHITTKNQLNIYFK